jgi:predicted Fe-S protein YdhL (DUF1289 family)
MTKTETKKETKAKELTALRDKLATDKVRYVIANAAVVVIDNPDSTLVQKDDGSFGKMKKDGIYLTRIRGMRHSPVSEQFDPMQEDQKKYIDIVDEWIKDNPDAARRAGVFKLGTRRPNERIANWDHMDASQIEAVMRATETDVIWAIQYELNRDEEDGGPRKDVIQVIEKIYGEKVGEAA